MFGSVEIKSISSFHKRTFREKIYLIRVLIFNLDYLIFKDGTNDCKISFQTR